MLHNVYVCFIVKKMEIRKFHVFRTEFKNVLSQSASSNVVFIDWRLWPCQLISAITTIQRHDRIMFALRSDLKTLISKTGHIHALTHYRNGDLASLWLSLVSCFILLRRLPYLKTAFSVFAQFHDLMVLKQQYISNYPSLQ